MMGFPIPYFSFMNFINCIKTFIFVIPDIAATNARYYCLSDSQIKRFFTFSNLILNLNRIT